MNVVFTWATVTILLVGSTIFFSRIVFGLVLVLPLAVESQTVRFFASCVIWFHLNGIRSFFRCRQWKQNDINNFFLFFFSISRRSFSVYTVWFVAESVKWMSCTFVSFFSVSLDLKNSNGSCMINKCGMLIRVRNRTNKKLRWSLDWGKYFAGFFNCIALELEIIWRIFRN